jgi:hypothetical protein
MTYQLLTTMMSAAFFIALHNNKVFMLTFLIEALLYRIHTADERQHSDKNPWLTMNTRNANDDNSDSTTIDQLK